MATQLRPFLSDIANAIRSKKGTSGVINAQNFASEIASIPTGGGENPLQALVSGRGADAGYYLCSFYQDDNVDFLSGIDFSATTNMSYMFISCVNITTIPLLDTSATTNMSYMFRNCSKLTTIPLLDTSATTNMSRMFYDCSSLITIPQFNTSSATDMSYMFSGCGSLPALPQLDTIKATNMQNMFGNCYALLTLPQLDTIKATNMQNMFQGCYKLQTIDITKLANNNSSFASACRSLTKLIIRTMNTTPTFGSNMFQSCYHFTGTVDSSRNPDGLKDGRIYVPDAQVDNLKAATGWADFADIIVPLSTLVE